MFFIFFSWKNSFLFSLIFGLPVLIITFTYMILHKYNIEDIVLMPGLSLQNLVVFVLCSIVQVSEIMYICGSFNFVNTRMLLIKDMGI